MFPCAARRKQVNLDCSGPLDTDWDIHFDVAHRLDFGFGNDMLPSFDGP
jgi:hypothetical protein